MKYNPDIYPFKSHWINLDDNEVHYIDEGEGPVLLFSHPPLGSSFMYRNFIKVLRKKYRCIVIDYPGFGLSKADPAYEVGLDGQRRILELFITRLRLENIFLLGHDTGGPSAFKVVADHPEWFSGLILTDTIIYPVSEYPKISRMLGIVGSSLFGWLNASTNLLVWLTFNFGVQSRKLSKEEYRQYQKLFNTKEKRRQITRMLYSLKESEPFMQDLKAGFETKLNSMPALLIYGENDPVKEIGIADRIHQLLPNSELFLIPNEGHFPHEGQPESMCEIMDTWLAKYCQSDVIENMAA